MKDRDFDVIRETARKDVKEDNLLTYADYLRTPSGLRYELVEGELRMTSSPNALHQSVSKRLVRVLMEQLEDMGIGEVFFAPLDVVLSEHNVVQPDVFFVSKDRLDIVKPESVQGTPDLVIEVLSQSTESWDRVSKRRIYSQYGVREFWIVDPNSRTIEVAIRKAGSLTTVCTYHSGETVSSPLFPSLRTATGPLFGE